MTPNDWKHELLQNLVEIRHGFAFKSEFFQPEPNGTILLTPGNFHVEQKLYFGKNTKYYNGDVPEDYILKNGDLLVVMTDLTKEMAILGNTVILNSEQTVLHNQRIGKIIPNSNEEVTRDFLNLLLNMNFIRRQLKATASGTTVRHTSPQKILDIKIAYPSISEQQRIVDFLSNWTRAIEGIESQIALKQMRMRGIMRILLRGEKRLPGSNDEWSSIRLEDAVTIKYGKSPSEVKSNDGKFPIVGSSGIVGKSSRALVEDRTLILGRKGTIDKPFIVEEASWPIDTTFYCVQKDGFSLDFLYFFLDLFNVARLNEASGVPSLSRENLYKIKLRIPKLTEQKEIARVLMLLKSELTLLRQLKSALASQRNGLSQVLLTGKRRLVTGNSNA